MLTVLAKYTVIRQALWRFGRKLYSAARFDGPNNRVIIGEYRLLDIVLGAGIDGVYVDVGANRGERTAALLRSATRLRQPCPTVICVEPNPEMAQHLRTRFGGRFSVLVEEVALSVTTGHQYFFVEKTSGGTSSLWRSDPNALEIQVRVTTFAELQEKYRRFAMVKIDAEGADYLILEGMSDAFAHRAVAFCQFEYNWRWRLSRSFLHDAWKFAQKHRYCFAKCTPHGPIVIRSWNDELERFFEGNYLVIDHTVAERCAIPSVDWTGFNTF